MFYVSEPWRVFHWLLAMMVNLRTYCVSRMNFVFGLFEFRRVHLNTDWSSLAEFDDVMDTINSQVVRDTCMKYIYDKCPVVSGYGK